ncbi:MAG: hypothetical protein P4M01_10890 [Acidobacteriota bacterium]|nr:hypothetical protein [Acidobacteriota bacterium]
MKKTIYVLLFLCLGLQGILGYKIWRRLQTETLDVTPPKLTFRAARQIFPYSVIPGGVMDEHELADSMAKDDVVRKHYEGLQPERMWFTRLKQPMQAFVSYRKGNDVRWTSHAVMIPANELVLTDGKHMVRARCGNRIEVKKPEPLPTAVLPPDVPPPDIAMDSGLPSLEPPNILPPTLPNEQIARNNGAQPHGISTPPTVWCCGTTSSSSQPPVVPEPPTVLLVIGGGLLLAGTVLGRKLL